MGWNWTNAMSASVAPARAAIASPSAVAAGGLEVSRNTCPAPPEARIVVRAQIIWSP